MAVTFFVEVVDVEVGHDQRAFLLKRIHIPLVNGRGIKHNEFLVGCR